VAIGTPTDRGRDRRFITTSDLTSNTFTPSAGEFIWCHIVTSGTSVTADSITGHDGGISWTQVGSTETSGGISWSWWAAIAGSSPSSGVVTVSRSASALMTATFGSVTGVHKGTVISDSLEQTDQNNAYTSSLSLTLTGATSLVLGFWGCKSHITMTPENTFLNDYQSAYNGNGKITCDYAASGDATPSCTLDSSSNAGYFAAELKAAAAGVTPEIVTPQPYTILRKRMYG